MDSDTPFYPDDPTRGGVEEAVSELEAQILLLKEELGMYVKPINPSWYEHFNGNTQKAGPGSGSGRDRHVRSLEDDIKSLEAQLVRIRLRMP